MEGFLPPEWCLFWFFISIPILTWGVLRVRRLLREQPEKKIMVAIAGAFMFVLSSLKLPSVTGSSSHPTGTGVSTVLYGVAVTSVLSVIVLLFQALLIAHGGLTTLGANLFSMGIAGPFVAFLAYRSLRRVNASFALSVFVAAFLADLITYVVTAMQLALAYPSAGGVIGSMTVFLEIFAITQVPLAIVEGVITAMFFDFLSRVRPDIIEAPAVSAKMSGRAKYAIASAVVILILSIALVMNSSEFMGSDDAGMNQIIQLDPEYIPWIDPAWEIPGSLQSPLLIIQAAIGLLIIGYAVIFTRNQRQTSQGG
jgi:cobalt/nickel transport system permease protein